MPCSVKSCEAFRTEGPDAPEARARSGRRWRTNNTFTNLNVCCFFQVDSLVKPHVEATNSDDMLGRQTLRTDQGEERELHLPPPFKWTASGPPL